MCPCDMDATTPPWMCLWKWKDFIAKGPYWEEIISLSVFLLSFHYQFAMWFNWWHDWSQIKEPSTKIPNRFASYFYSFIFADNIWTYAHAWSHTFFNLKRYLAIFFQGRGLSDVFKSRKFSPQNLNLWTNIGDKF